MLAFLYCLIPVSRTTDSGKGRLRWKMVSSKVIDGMVSLPIHPVTSHTLCLTANPWVTPVRRRTGWASRLFPTSLASTHVHVSDVRGDGGTTPHVTRTSLDEADGGPVRNCHDDRPFSSRERGIRFSSVSVDPVGGPRVRRVVVTSHPPRRGK